MKKKLSIFLIAAIGIHAATFAQSRSSMNGPVTPVQLGSVIFNVGLGVGSSYKGDYYNTAFGTKASLEFGLWQAGPGVVTLGAEVGGSFSNGGHADNYTSRTIIVTPRSAWHYGWNVRGLDTYGGVAAGIGFHHYHYRDTDDFDKSEVIPVVGAFIGASYFISPSFGFNAEAGRDITDFQIGIVLKIH